VQIGDDRISFKWEPGDLPVECTLEQDSGRTYFGECPDPEGGPSVKLTLVPPAQE
jgi:hypothetical protein